MGIKHFFYWFKNMFSKHITPINETETFLDEHISIDVDNLMIDLNGIFHNAAQRVYKYGAFAPPETKRLLGPSKPRQKPKLTRHNQLQCFQEISRQIEDIVGIVNPSKRIVLCIDGPAPISKQNQQRQRRFRSALSREDDDDSFDSNCITPGTQFMDYLSKYLDWFIRKKVSEEWSGLEVIFSNEKSPGEGEHKLINYIRLYGDPNESYCIQGADADLIMLSLSTHFPKFYILRDNMNKPCNYFAIDIRNVRQELISMLKWSATDESKYRQFDEKLAINDFVFMCFLVGNDFLPHIPAIEIAENGIETMISVYITTASQHGHLTKLVKKHLRFSKPALQSFLKSLSCYEKEILQDKLNKNEDFFPDPVLEKNTSQDNEGNFLVDINSYKEDYYSANLPYKEEEICHNYIEGLQWVLTYYSEGVSNWKWRYPYHYAPFASTLSQHVGTFRLFVYPTTNPTTPFIQLLSVLPPKSANLIPPPLSKLLTDEKSPLMKYCPKEFGIDLSGKRKEWEGIVILPMVDYKEIEKVCYKHFRSINKKDMKRNFLGKTFKYTHSSTGYLFRSFYGDFECHAQVQFISI